MFMQKSLEGMMEGRMKEVARIFGSDGSGKKAFRIGALLRVAVAIAAVCLFSGCIQDNVLVNIKPDGSGTIEETVLVSNSFIEMMQDIGKDFKEEGKEGTKQEGAAAEKKKPPDVVGEMMEKAQKSENDFGEGVKFVSAKRSKTDTASGYTAIYSFRDINKVTLNQNPGKKTPGDESKKDKNGGDKDASKNDTIKFAFIKGSPAKLTVQMPPPKAKKDEKSAAPEKDKPQATDDPKAIEMMKTIFKDMRVSIVLNIDGDIVNTNATHRSGRKITLIDMDFGKLIGDIELLKKINKEQPETLEEMKKMVKGIEGLKLEFNSPVTVEFK